MTNPSLKEQLQALSLGSSTPVAKKSQTSKATLSSSPRPGIKKAKPTQQKPAWLEYAQYGVELLKAYFPLCFKEAKEIQPLKIGIKQDLVMSLSTREEIAISDKACMVTSLAYYVNSLHYQKNMLEGAMRIDLNGLATSAVTAEEAQHSVDSRNAKLLKKKPISTSGDTSL